MVDGKTSCCCLLLGRDLLNASVNLFNAELQLGLRRLLVLLSTSVICWLPIRIEQRSNTLVQVCKDCDKCAKTALLLGEELLVECVLDGLADTAGAVV
eukprot:677643-Amphidinium_carterae.3